MPQPIESLLSELGPSRTGRLVAALTDSLDISTQAARQRLSRARTPIERYPGQILPKREAFFYLRCQRNSELYWENLMRDLRETGAVYACAIDGLRARGGVVPVDEFAVVSGAPIALKKQVPSHGVAERLVDLGVIHEYDYGPLGRCFVADSAAVVQPLKPSQIIARRQTECVMLDGLREWLRKNGIGSFERISIRGEGHPLKVGQFKWDLTGPSYLLSVRRSSKVGGIMNGFVVADVFAGDRLNKFDIRYFVRKVQVYQQTSNSGSLFPILMAQSFTGEAMSEGHRAGLMLTTPQNLFGQAVANALADLIATLGNAAAIAAVDPDRLCRLLDQLSEIEGRASNVRGILFELIAAHIAKREYGGSIDIGKLHSHRQSGKTVELDVVCVTDRASVHLIECKGKNPGGIVSKEDVSEWIRKLPVMQDYVASREHLRERNQTFEFWTTGTIASGAAEVLKEERARRTKRPIAWKDGRQVRRMAAELKLKSIGDALDQHFLKHPLARATN